MLKGSETMIHNTQCMMFHRSMLKVCLKFGFFCAGYQLC